VARTSGVRQRLVATAAKFACVASGGPTEQQNQRVIAPTNAMRSKFIEKEADDAG